MENTITNKLLNLTLYIVVNSKGQFFRAKGYEGSGQSWVDDINKARLYSKLSPARSVVTFYSKNPKLPGPDIFKLSFGSCEIMIEEKERALKAVAKIKKKNEEYNLRIAKRSLEDAIENFKEAEKKLEQERNKLK